MALGLIGSFLFLPGCSVRRFAIRKLGDALAQSGGTFASDDDPDLVKAAAPFSLKLIESLLTETPNHTGLLLAAASGFTQYSYAFVQEDADELEDKDLAASQALRARARKLYLRARDYGLRGLETKHAGFGRSLRENPKSAVRAATKADVPLLYWTAAAWGLAITPDDPGANLAVGQFLCFVKGDWESGLPLLAKSDDNVLKTLA
ncbi:MAG: hypothetical protein HY300_15015, partial [Verrucomicrobia bacterium]|nr:hypothetical protein [Verrucomicrobiota bacterium]